MERTPIFWQRHAITFDDHAEYFFETEVSVEGFEEPHSVIVAPKLRSTVWNISCHQ